MKLLVLLSAIPIWFFVGLFLYGFLSDQMGVSERASKVLAWGLPPLIFAAWVYSGR